MKETIDPTVEQKRKLGDDETMIDGRFVTVRSPRDDNEEKKTEEGNDSDGFDNSGEEEWVTRKENGEKCRCHEGMKEIKALKLRLESMEKLIETLMIEKRESEKKMEEVRIDLKKERAQRIRDAKEEREEIGIIREKLDQDKVEIERGERKAEGMKNQLEALRQEINNLNLINEKRNEEEKRKATANSNKGMQRREDELNDSSRTDENGNDTGNKNKDKTTTRIERPERLEGLDLDAEKARRHKNEGKILVKGAKGRNDREVDEVVRTINNRLGISMRITDTSVTHEGLVINVSSIREKIMIMRNKFKLRGTPVVLGDVLTWRERAVQEWVENFATELREDGEEIQTGYLKLKLRGTWLEWEEEEGDLRPGKEKVFFQRRG